MQITEDTFLDEFEKRCKTNRIGSTEMMIYYMAREILKELQELKEMICENSNSK